MTRIWAAQHQTHRNLGRIGIEENTHITRVSNYTKKRDFSKSLWLSTTFLQIVSKSNLQLGIHFLASVLSFYVRFTWIESHICKVLPPYYQHGITFMNLWHENAESGYDPIVSAVECKIQVSDNHVLISSPRFPWKLVAGSFSNKLYATCSLLYVVVWFCHSFRSVVLVRKCCYWLVTTYL